MISFLRSASSSVLSKDLDDVTIPDFSDVRQQESMAAFSQLTKELAFLIEFLTQCGFVLSVSVSVSLAPSVQLVIQNNLTWILACNL